MYFQLSSSLGVWWSHRGGAWGPWSFHPILTDPNATPTPGRNTLLQNKKKKNAVLTIFTFFTDSYRCHHLSEASLYPAFPPQVPPDLQMKHGRGLKGALMERSGQREETFGRSDHLEAPLKGSF